MQKVNEFLTDLVVSKFSCLLGGLHAIQDLKQMENELLRGMLKD